MKPSHDESGGNTKGRTTGRRSGGPSVPVDLLHTAQLTLIGEMSAGLAHEIKNPLAAIKGALDILLRRPNIPEDCATIMQDVLEQVARIDSTVSSLLQHATPRPIQLVAADLTEVVRDAVSLAKDVVLRPACSAGQRIELSLELPDESIPVRIDPMHVETALLNLVKNAAEAIEIQGRICVRVGVEHRDGPSVAVVEVIDTGRGIAPEEIPQLFHTFYTTKKTGTGLGLPAVQRIARGHGGRVIVDSTPGASTRFALELPLSGVEPTAS